MKRRTQSTLVTHVVPNGTLRPLSARIQKLSNAEKAQALFVVGSVLYFAGRILF